MKKNICLLVFISAAIIAMALRAYELVSLIETETGFIISSRYTAAVIVTVSVALVVFLSSAFVSVSAINGKKNKSFYLMPSVCSLFLGAAAALEVKENFTGTPEFLKVLCIVFAVLSAVYFIAFSLRILIHFPLSACFSIIPGIFFVLKAACVSIKNAYHTIISDTIFEIAAYCLIMLFFLEFARLANGRASKTSIKRFSAFGCAAALLSFTFSVPKILVSPVSSSAAYTVSINEYLLFLTGLYIACEVFSRVLFAQQQDKKVSIYYTGKH